MIAVINAKIMTITKGVIYKGSILIDGPRIQAVGEHLPIPVDAEIFDLSGRIVTPGLIDAHCHTGIFADGVGGEASDGNEMTDPVTPHLRALDAIHPEDIAFADLICGGVTAINTGPGSGNLIGGQFVCLKTKKARTIGDITILAPSGMKMALGENPKRVYGEQKRLPSTRMGNAARLRSALVEAENYRRKWLRYEEKQNRFEEKLAAWQTSAETALGGRPEPPDKPERDLRHEALIPVLEGRLRAMIHCHRADDIMTAIRIAEEFGLKFSIEHATEGYKIADILAEKNIPCVVGPIMISRTKYELRELSPHNPGLLSRAGVKVAIQTDEMSAVRYLVQNAALAVQHGMDEEQAFRAITISPAEIIGVDQRLGSIEPGKDADLVVFSGHPFDYRTTVDMVFIDGRLEYRRQGIESCQIRAFGAQEWISSHGQGK